VKHTVHIYTLLLHLDLESSNKYKEEKFPVFVVSFINN